MMETATIVQEMERHNCHVAFSVDRSVTYVNIVLLFTNFFNFSFFVLEFVYSIFEGLMC